MNYGYIRVSTKEQNEDRQRVAMDSFGIGEKQIYADKQSGKDFARPAYAKLLKTLKPQDTLVVKSIDRLGRNYDEIIEQWRILTKERRVDIVVLDMPLLDTRKKERDLTGVFISDLVLQILSYVAQTERENIHKRQAEGIEVAKKNGVRFGRPPKDRPSYFHEVHDRYNKGEINMQKLTELLGISRATYYRWKSQAAVYSDKLNSLCL